MANTVLRTYHSQGEVYTSLCEAAHQGAYTAYIRGTRCQTEMAYYYEVSASFQFPWYFGHNIHALDECLCDLEWLSFSRIFVVMEDFGLSFGANEYDHKWLIRHWEFMAKEWEKEGVPVEVWLNN